MAINFSASFAACLAAGLKVPRQIMYCISQGRDRLLKMLKTIFQKRLLLTCFVLSNCNCQSVVTPPPPPPPTPHTMPLMHTHSSACAHCTRTHKRKVPLTRTLKHRSSSLHPSSTRSAFTSCFPLNVRTRFSLKKNNSSNNQEDE